MNIELFFYIAFIGQIIYLSYIIPKQMQNRIQYVFESFPEKEYPKLYPESLEYYKYAKKNYRNINYFVMILGFILLALFLKVDALKEWQRALVTTYFVLQFIPLMFTGIWSPRYYKQMRFVRKKIQREADLAPRRFFNMVSMPLFGIVIGVFLAFCGFIYYVEQFNYSWFGGYANIGICAAVNLYYLILILYKISGKKRDLYQANIDRQNEIRFLFKQLSFISIGMTVYITTEICLAMFELKELSSLINTIYLQIIAFFGIGQVKIDDIDFEVYRDQSDTSHAF